MTPSGLTGRKIDLSFPIHEGMTSFAAHWHPKVEVTQLGRHGVEERETRRLVLGTHTGTHCDAPRHFIPDGETIDNIPIETLVGPAIILDLSDTAPRQRVEASDLAALLGDRRPERLILRYDWSAHWSEPTYYADHPFLSPEAARLLVDRGVRMLGMDTPMPDDPTQGWRNDPDSPIHRILLGAGVVLVEYLANLGEIRQTEIDLIVMPLKIRDGDGSPARVVAIEH